MEPEPLEVVPIYPISPIPPAEVFSTSTTSDDPPPEDDDGAITVTGHRYSPWIHIEWYETVFQSEYWNAPVGLDPLSEEELDSDDHEIVVTFTRARTAVEQAAIEALNDRAEAFGPLLLDLFDSRGLPFNSLYISAAELKALYANLDFVVNEAGTTYDNLSDRGRANYNNGNPVVSVNINTLVQYYQLGVAGLNYFILHELGHITAAGRAVATEFANGRASYADNERWANDFARALASELGVLVIDNPTYGYSGSAPAFTNMPLGTETSYLLDLPFQFAEISWNAFLSLNDFSGDHRSDILGRADDGTINYLLGGPDGGVSVVGGAFGQIPASWKILGTGDFNGDGRSDLLWRHDTGVVSNWLATAQGFVSNDANAWSVVDSSWTIVGVGDFNRDGLADILWRQNTGILANWLGTSSGGYTANDENAWYNVSTIWRVVATGDFNGDGYSDILWRHEDGTIGEWLGGESGGFTINNAALVSVSNNWHVIGTGDFNGDGRADILWRNDSGTISTWLGTYTGDFVVNDAIAYQQVSLDWHIADIADYNGDGRDDILWRSNSNWIGNWLGTAAGGFVNNEVNSLTAVSLDWRVVAPDVLWM